MEVVTRTISLETEGNMDIINLTDRLKSLANSVDITNGIVHIFAPGSTMGLTTVEFEGGLVQDLKDVFDKAKNQNLTFFYSVYFHVYK